MTEATTPSIDAPGAVLTYDVRSVGSMVTQLAREAGAYVIGTGRAADREKTLDFGAMELSTLRTTRWKTSAELTWCSTSSAATSRSGPRPLIKAGGTLVIIAGPVEARPADGLAVDLVVLPDRAQLGEIVQRAGQTAADEHRQRRDAQRRRHRLQSDRADRGQTIIRIRA